MPLASFLGCTLKGQGLAHRTQEIEALSRRVEEQGHQGDLAARDMLQQIDKILKDLAEFHRARSQDTRKGSTASTHDCAVVVTNHHQHRRLRIRHCDVYLSQVFRCQ